MTTTDPVVVAAATRTAIGKFLGMYKKLTAPDLGMHAIQGLLERAGVDPASVDEVIMGCGRQAGAGPNIARQCSVRAGIPDTVPAYTVNMACISSLKAITLGQSSIERGEAEIVVAGGTESMTGLPFMLPNMRLGHRLGHAKVEDAMYRDGFNCPLSEMVMGETAELLAHELEITREEQDRYAERTQQRAGKAIETGRFKDEITPITIHDRKKGDIVCDTDEHPRPDSTVEGMQKLKPAFPREDGTGTIHPGNASGITDGAAALLLMRRSKAEALGIDPLATVAESSIKGGDPARMGIVPVPACQAIEERTGMRIADFDLVEINEAFAAQVLACHRDLAFDWDKTNVNGGAIALGHPIGASGARITVTLLHEMLKRDAKHGLATACASGGMGQAIHFTR